MKAIPTKMQTVEMGTGKVIKTEFVPMHLMPPRAGLCAVCAHDHAADAPHNAQSLYWGVAFKADTGRAPMIVRMAALALLVAWATPSAMTVAQSCRTKTQI